MMQSRFEQWRSKDVAAFVADFPANKRLKCATTPPVGMRTLAERKRKTALPALIG
jgi:hypothetical protein